MFNAINNLTPSGVPYESFPDDAVETKNELDRRMGIVEEFIKDLGLNAGLDQAKLDVLEIKRHESFDSAEMNHGLFSEKPYIGAPLILFIDFIKDFDVENLENLEQELQDLNNVGRFREKLCHIFDGKISATDEVLRDTLLPLVQQMRANADNMLNESRFVLLHELGHLQNDALSLLWTIAIALSIDLAVLFSVIKIASIITKNELFKFIASIVGCILAVKIALLATEILRAQTFGRWSEIAADRFAVEACPSDQREQIRQAGISHFQKNNDKWEKLKDLHGIEPSWFDRLFDSHPTDDERIAMLENLA